MGRATGTRLIPILVLLALLGIPGCDDDPVTLPSTPDRYADPNSPEEVLANFVAAHARLDLEAYGATLAEEFVFYPSPQNHVGFRRLRKERDVATMSAVFADAMTTDVRLTPAPSVPSQVDEFPAAEGFMQIEASAVIHVVMDWSDQGTPLGYSTLPASVTFVFEPDSSSSPPTWTIRYQADHGQSGSWANIKSLFLQPVPYQPPTSPENVLDNLVTAHQEFDITGYRDLKAVNFRFIPSPSDTLPFQSLDWEEDDRVTRQMFWSVDDLEIDLIHDDSEPSARQEFPADQGYRQIAARATLRVTVEGVPGDTLIFIVDDDPALFIFEPDSSATPVSWKVVLQEDGEAFRGTSPPTVEGLITSWGGLKSMFR